MGSMCLVRAACVVVVVAGLGVGSVAHTAPAGVPDAPAPRSVPELRPGEIVIRKTGRKRLTRAASPAPTTAPARGDADRPADGPGPRSVTIGYFYREPLETGWGPRVYEGPPVHGGYCASDYGGYPFGFSTGYSRGFPPSSCFTPAYCEPPLLFGSRPYSTRSSPPPVARPWARR